jgi:hypothetical protein
MRGDSVVRVKCHYSRSVVIRGGHVAGFDTGLEPAIFLASHIIDERADFLGRQQHSGKHFKAGLIENGLIQPIAEERGLISPQMSGF